MKKLVVSTLAALGIVFSMNANADIPWNILENGGLTLGGNSLHPGISSLYIVLSTVPNGGTLASSIGPGAVLLGTNDETIQVQKAVTAQGPQGGPPTGGTFMIDNTAGDDIAVDASTVDLIARVFAADSSGNVIAGTRFLTRVYPDPADTDASPIPDTPMGIGWSDGANQRTPFEGPAANAAPGVVVPEPGMLALLGIGALTLLRLRRRD